MKTKHTKILEKIREAIDKSSTMDEVKWYKLQTDYGDALRDFYGGDWIYDCPHKYFVVYDYLGWVSHYAHTGEYNKRLKNLEEALELVLPPSLKRSAGDESSQEVDDRVG